MSYFIFQHMVTGVKAKLTNIYVIMMNPVGQKKIAGDQYHFFTLSMFAEKNIFTLKHRRFFY